jgi:DNA-nicking Smr family endonuclease
MKERKRPAPRSAGRDPFAALRGWKASDGAVAATPQKRSVSKARDEHRDEDAADRALFLKAVGDARPVRDGGRVLLETPPPAPLPRPKPPSEHSPLRRAAIETDPLRAAYEGVQRLRDDGRVEFVPPRRPAGPSRAGAPLGEAFVPTTGTAYLALHADADLADPATLFRQLMQGTQPVDDRNRVELAVPPPLPMPIKRDADERAALDESLATPLSLEDRLDAGDEAAFLRPGVPRRVLSDLRRGRWVLQGQLDLHGHTRDEARAALARYLSASLQQGYRCIRVIHGKGLGSPGRFSILKELSRGWLAQREEILAFCQAGPHDGGGGALLVLLRAQQRPPAPRP